MRLLWGVVLILMATGWGVSGAFVRGGVALSLGLGNERALLQRRRREADSIVGSELELQTALLTIQENQTIELDVSEINLTTTVVLTTQGVTLRGRTSGTTIRCASLVPQTAFLINAVDVRLESLNITRCLFQSAVVVEPVQGDASERQRVTMRDVQFFRNGGRRRGIFGGAMRTGLCLIEPCRRLALRIQSCRFSENLGYYGGAIFAIDADVEIQSSIFEGNAADATGGALFLNNQREANLSIEDSEFHRNRAHGDSGAEAIEEVFGLAQSQIAFGMGGAVSALNCLETRIRGSRFTHNIGCAGGGALTAVHDELRDSEDAAYVFAVTDSYFERNDGFCGNQTDGLEFVLLGRNSGKGGGIHYEALREVRVDWSVQNSTFLRNYARIGGSVSVTSLAVSPARHHFKACIFAENIALVSAGGVSLESAHATAIGTVFRYNKGIYGGAWLVTRQATLTTLPHPTDPEEVNLVEHGQAIFGGGIFAEGISGMNLSSIEIRNNTAYRYGGGVRIFNVPAQVVLRGATVEDNEALTGGGLAVLAVMSIQITRDETGRRSVFRNNTAAIGGGLYYEPGHAIFLVIQIEFADFAENQAMSSAEPRMEKLRADGDAFEPLPEANVEMPDVEEQLGNFTLLSFLTDVGEGHGGGICLTVLNIRLFTVVEIVFRNVTLTQNAAVVGAAFGLDTCQRFVFHNVTVTQNRALYAGGVFATLADGIAISCDPQSEYWITSSDFVEGASDTDQLQQVCSYVFDNQISDGAAIQGSDAGTRAVSLAVEGWTGPLQIVASEDVLAIPCQEDPHNVSCSRPLSIAVRDAFEQTIVRGIDDADLELTLVSDSIIGSLRYTAERGIAVIDRTQAWGVNRHSTLTIVSEKDQEVSLELALSTRDCYPGEIDGGNVCRPCPSEQYGFAPDGRCRSCEKHATCNGGAALVPSRGYWHSTPFSPLMHPCIHPEACNYEGREEHLGQFYQNASRLNEDVQLLTAFIAGEGEEPMFEYRQCAEGYQGTFCGSCVDGFGHSRTGACEECPEDQSRQRGFVFLAALWLFLLFGANCAISLFSMDTRVRLVKNELQAVSVNPQTLERAPHVGRREIRSSRIMRRGSRISPQTSEGAEGALHEILAETVVSTVQLTETLKILINYLQVTSAALQLQTNWNTLLNGLLVTQAGFVGLSSEVLDVPLECNFDNGDGPPASISAWWMRLMTPGIILSALLLGFTMAWLLLKLRSRRVSSQTEEPRSRQHLLTCLIVITVVSLYFSYIGLVKELLRAVNCIEIEEAHQLVPLDHPYLIYAVETGDQRVWAEDTDLTCFRGSHLLVGIVGVIGLTLALMGVICIIVWLPLNKRHVTNTQFISRYWFLYQAYRKEWYTNAWESTILTRKALIAAVVVFSVHLGPTLQASMCTGILIIAHIMHCAFGPFKDLGEYGYVPDYAGHSLEALRLPKLAHRWVDLNNSIHLNSLESASLASSIIVFFSAIVLHDSNSSAVGRAAMVAFTFITNVAFLLYMGYRLYAGLHIFLDLKLEMHNAAFMAAHDNSLGLWSLIFKSVAMIQGTRSKQMSHDTFSANPPQSLDTEIPEDPPNV